MSYGGFIFTNRITLKDEFLIPNGDYQYCHAAHGNVTYISQSVVDKLGVLCEGYLHGGGDHDYTYRAYRNGIPVIVMKSYVGECENDHKVEEYSLVNMTLKERFSYIKKPLGYNLNNTLLFQKRCFPYRYPIVLGMSYFRVFFPKFYLSVYNFIRR